MKEKRAWKEKYIGDKAFYMRVFILVIPMILQATITNAVSLLDNVMVGKVGTAQMSGVSIVNQFIFIFNITIFGAVSGPSIFGAQFCGKSDYEGQKYTFRFRLLVSAVLVFLGITVLQGFSTQLISLYLSKKDSKKMIAATLHYGKEYMEIMVLGLIPFGIGQAYASVVRESGITIVQMLASFFAVGINLVLDYGLIFGKLGMPQMGVSGAALATVIAKSIEAFIIIVWVHADKKRNPYIKGIFKGFYIPADLTKQMIKKGFPLFVNEFLWAAGMSVIAQCYSARGINVVAARNIASTIGNLFNVVFIQMGACIGIIVGQSLGAGKQEEARDENNKLLAFSVFLSAIAGMLMLPLAKCFPDFYNTEIQIKKLASFFIIVQALANPMWSYTNACYFTLRSGGKTGITFLFDFIFTWFIMIPLAFVLAYFTDMEIHLLFVVITFSELIKVAVGYFMVRSDIWVNTIIE
ncbi:MATE family efflux transporter [[Clostridium] polysaccharolyticum]|jgi:putative MATE family efflux protein|uniref:Probable multidrug resistance protein NorM n=1 Tax=[Clostridium] polysaccharolyticum TaxID=29364 RepID=A0A1I0FXV8_9FIRM|nr:MATE family efflux transporter [[Clostridium] polysaccharolyticum]SET63212.1 putative efflux protein, MATE family [[Clostridium] polysaccharolyticum]